MNKINENRLVPKLRFPEFHNNETWQKKSLNEISSALLDGDWIESKDQSNNGVRLIQTGNIGVGEFLLKPQNARYISEETFERLNCTEIFPGDCLVSRLPDPIGRSCFIPDIKVRMITAVDCLIIRFNKNQVVPYLFVLYSQTDKYFAEIKALASGSTRERISKENLSRIKIPITQITEQQKIATCLSALDEVITAESQKLYILQDHKRGLLQNLLPQEGETVPKFRFKEFRNRGDWEETTLIQVADYENGKAHEQDIADDGEFIVVNSKFISQDGKIKKFTNTAFCPATKGDVLMVLSDIPNGKAIAKCFLVEEDNHYTVNQRICRISPRKLNSKILYYLLNRNPYFLAFDDGVKQTNLRKEDVLNCPLLIPSDPKEQEKIADTLSSIDELINAQNQKVEILKLHKKGLLQGLFPCITN